MKIAKAGNIHSFCHPNSLFTLQVRALAGRGLAQPAWQPCLDGVLHTARHNRRSDLTVHQRICSHPPAH